MDYQFTETLTARDVKRHIPHSFIVPANASQVELYLHFKPERVEGIQNMLTLTLFDPNGFRGAGHRGGSTHIVQLTPNSATPGYLTGPLPAGEWVVQIDTHMIMSGVACQYELKITVNEASSEHPLPTQMPQAYPVPNLPSRGPGWVIGDLHSHTNHSDADDRTVAELIQKAREYKLDFIFLTDHNTVSPLEEMYASATPDLLTLGGLELTTFWGHALCLGTRDWVDWRVRAGTGEMPNIATATYAKEQVFIIAHPCAIGDPECTGCKWVYLDMMPGTSHLVEIWNTTWESDSHNEQALMLWYSWLNQGLRMVATAGTDTHGNDDYAHKPGFCHIYVQEFSERGILKALRAGHLYLSNGPRLTLTAQGGGSGELMMGDLFVGDVARLALHWSDCPADAQARVIADGKPLIQWVANSGGQRDWTLIAGQVQWCVVEVRSAEGAILAVTNPIFLRSPH
ncbi:CehA/McbA family metallohydrolase [soil metagenome]